MSSRLFRPSAAFVVAAVVFGALSAPSTAAEATKWSFPSAGKYTACVLDKRTKSAESGKAAVDKAISACRGAADDYADDLFEAYDTYRRADFFGTKTRLIKEIEARAANRLSAMFP